MQWMRAQLLAAVLVLSSAAQAAANVLGAFVPGDTHSHHVLLNVVLALLCAALGVAVAAILRARGLRIRLEMQARELTDELEQRKVAERQLRERDTSLRAILDNTDTVVFTLAPDGTILLAEGRGLTGLKRPPEGNIGRRFQDAHPDRQDLVLLLDRCLRGETVQAVVPYSKGMFQLLASPLRAQDGGVEGVVGILADITEIDAMRARLAESEARFRSIFENAPYAIVINRMSDGAYVDANPVFLRQLGISREALNGLDPNVVNPMPDGEALAFRRALAEQGGLKDQEASFARPDGSVAHVLYSSAPVTVDGEPCLISVTVDMTARRQAELALKQSEEQYRAIFNNSPIGIYRSTFGGRLVEANPTLARMLGYASREELLAEVGDLARDMYPSQAERKRLLDALLASSGGVSMEIEFKRRDGSPFHAIIHASLQFEANGAPGWLDGTIEDISERKRAENALRESEALLRALKESNPDLVWLKDSDGVYLSCNPAFERFYGAPERDILGRRDHDFVDAELADFFLANDRKAMEAGRPTRNEEWLTFADTGYRGLFETIKTPMRDASGKLVGVLGISRDVTERKERELELQRWMQRFDIVNTAAQHIFYDYDLARDEIQWKGATQEVLGIPAEALTGPLSKWADLLHPEDAPEVLRRMDEARSSCATFQADYRLRHRDGFYLHVHESGVFLPDETGQAAQMLGILQDISARKNAEMALAAREKMYRTLFESAQDTILILDGHRIVDCNPSAMTLFGCGRQLILGKTPAELSPLRQPSGEDSAAAMDRVLAKASSGGRLMFDWISSRADGLLVEVEVSLTPMDVAGTRYLLALLRDVTERKRSELLLKQSEEKFSKIFALAPYSISITRVADSVLLDANEAFETLTGYRREEVIGRSGDALGLWSDPEQRAAFVAQLLREGVVVDFEFLMRRKDGALRSALNSCQRIEVAGEICSMNFVRDITEMKLVQQAMVQTEKMMSLGGLAAGMAHEINNPLGIISQSVLGVQRRLDPEVPANRKEALALGVELEAVQEYLQRRNILRYLEGIREAGQRAAEIVRHMLNFSRRSDSGIVDQEPGALVRQALSLAEKDYDLKKKYDFRQIDVRLEFSEALPSVPCIPSEIEQVLLNLLRNAAQAMAEAGIRNPVITVRSARAGEHAVIEVEDNGPGIPASELGRVFEPFYTTKKVGEGTGLGLSVSYFIITNTHRGEMSVSSEPGRGTRFTIRLPLSRLPRVPAGGAAAPPSAG